MSLDDRAKRGKRRLTESQLLNAQMHWEAIESIRVQEWSKRQKAFDERVKGRHAANDYKASCDALVDAYTVVFDCERPVTPLTPAQATEWVVQSAYPALEQEAARRRGEILPKRQVPMLLNLLETLSQWQDVPRDHFAEFMSVFSRFVTFLEECKR